MILSLSFWLLSSVSPAQAASDVYIKVGGASGQAQLMAVAMPPFVADSKNSGKADSAALATQLRDIVRADLMFSRYFKIMEDGAAFDGANADKIAPDWKSRGAGWLLTAKAHATESTISISAKLIELNSKETVFERSFQQNSKFPRSLAHKLSDDITKALTGKPGIAHTKIAFSNDKSGHKEIYLMDYDGANLTQITRLNSITVLPRLSPNHKALVYTTYKRGNPDLVETDLEKGNAHAVSDQQGLNIAGGFSPDGNLLLMTLSREKSPNIYLKNLKEGTLTQLTQHFGADSSPTFSPDANQVAFVSDRAGNPQIYILDVATHRAKRLTNLNWCDSPSWSPTGEWIAFAGRVNKLDKMDIYLVDVTGSQVRQITKGEGSNENPTWSLDGRFIAFTSTRNGKSQLFVMDSDGSAPHPLTDLAGRSYTPNWSN